MAKSKSSSNKVERIEKLVSAIDTVTSLSQYITPEILNRVVTWLGDNHFSDRFIELVKQIHMPHITSTMDVIKSQCAAVDELINTKSENLSNDAPISQWRSELDKINTGVAMLEASPRKDHKKIKALKKRSDKLFDSAFRAAID